MILKYIIFLSPLFLRQLLFTGTTGLLQACLQLAHGHLLYSGQKGVSFIREGKSSKGLAMSSVVHFSVWDQSFTATPGSS